MIFEDACHLPLKYGQIYHHDIVKGIPSEIFLESKIYLKSLYPSINHAVLRISDHADLEMSGHVDLEIPDCVIFEMFT